MNQALTKQRIRISFGKLGFLRFVGHLDLAQSWERILRRAGIPLEYSQGYNPRPRMQFAAPLPVGVTSESEYVDVWLVERLADEWVVRLNAATPADLPVYCIAEVPIRARALPTLVTHADYVIRLLDDSLPRDEVQRRVDNLLAAPRIERVRRNKTYDLRPLILDLAVNDAGNITAQLVTGDRGNGRADELLDALGLAREQARLHRQRLHLSSTASQE
jgi:radical SAM-linked protein